METINIITVANVFILIGVISSLLFLRKIILYKSILSDNTDKHKNNSKATFYSILVFLGFIFDIFLIVIIILKIFDVVILFSFNDIIFILVGLFSRTSSLFYYIGYKKINS